MTKLTKAAVVHELGKPLVIEEVLLPEPGPTRSWCGSLGRGVCHADLHVTCRE
jgi:propanol-preferring alcohol dehydrogenase